MEKYTKRQLKNLVNYGNAIDLSYYDSEKAEELRKRVNLRQIGYASGVYGCSGMLFTDNDGNLYAVTSRTQAIYLF